MARVSVTVTRPGDATCTDSGVAPFARLDAFGAGSSVQLRLGFPREESPDGFRTHCSAPSQSDTLARGSLAAGHIARGRVGASSLTVELTRPGTFASGAYAGSRSGALELHLVRASVKLHVGTGRL